MSGMYLGEIARNILTALIDATPRALLFNGKSTPALNKHYGVDTSLLSSVEEAWEGNGETGATPQFSDLDPAKLELSVKAKLEKIRKVVVDQLGFHDEDVSLRDAAVCQLFFDFYHAHLTIHRLFDGHVHSWLVELLCSAALPSQLF